MAICQVLMVFGALLTALNPFRRLPRPTVLESVVVGRVEAVGDYQSWHGDGIHIYIYMLKASGTANGVLVALVVHFRVVAMHCFHALKWRSTVIENRHYLLAALLNSMFRFESEPCTALQENEHAPAPWQMRHEGSLSMASSF